MALTDANTYPTAGVLTGQMVSLYDSVKPQHIPILFARFGAQFMPFFEFIRAMGREEAIMDDNLTAHEENRYVDNIKVAANVGDQGAGNDLTFQLHADKVDANGFYFPRVGQTVIMHNEAMGHIYTIDDTASPPNITLKPVSATSTLGAVTTGMELAIISNAKSDGSAQPEGTRVGTSKRRFYAQILSETVEIHGRQLVKELWYKIKNDGGSVKGWYTPGVMRMEYMMALASDGAFLFGEERTNTTLVTKTGEAGAGEVINYTEGLFPKMRKHGHTISYTPGSFDALDFDQVGLYMKQQGVTSGHVVGMLGSEAYIDVREATKDYVDGGGTDYTNTVKALFGGNADLAAAVNFQVVKLGNVTYVLRELDHFNIPKTYGLTGYNMIKQGFFFPLTTTMAKVGGKKVKMDNIATRYLAKDGYSRRFETWATKGAGGGTYVHDIDKASYYSRADIMLQALMMNQTIVMDPS